MGARSTAAGTDEADEECEEAQQQQQEEQRHNCRSTMDASEGMEAQGQGGPSGGEAVAPPRRRERRDTWPSRVASVRCY